MPRADAPTQQHLEAMGRCNHSQWLSISSKENRTVLVESDRPQSLLAGIPLLQDQSPSLFVLIGSSRKALAVQELVSAKSVRSTRGRRAHGEIHLHLEPLSAFSERPIYIADSDLPERHRRGKALQAAACHETVGHPFLHTERHPLDAGTAAELVHARLLHPFSDVFCLFAIDLGGLREVSRQVAAWLEKPQASRLPSETFPALVIVVEGRTRAGEKAVEDWFLQSLAADTPKSLSDRFSSLEVVTLPQAGAMSNDARHRRLKDCLMRASDRVRKHRSACRSLFSARHFHAFFRLACRHLTAGGDEPFDFIAAARLHNPVASDLKQHLSNLVQLVESPRELIDVAAPMIASSLFLDSYPPDAPSKLRFPLSPRCGP